MMRLISLAFLSLVSVTKSQISEECPAGWIDGNFLGCYKFLDAKINMSWVEAQHECEVVGGYLAEPVTTGQAEFLAELAVLDQSFTGIGYWFLGLTDLGFEGEWSWMHNGRDLEDSFWAANHPSNKTGNKNDCAVLVLRNNGFTWEDHDCLAPQISNHVVAPACQYDTAASSTTVAPETTTAFSCPSGWSEFDGSCYRYFSQSQYWITAEKLCRDEGASLVSIHSSEENSFVLNLASATRYWIGAYRTGSNDFFWSDFTENDFSSFYNSDNGCIFQYDSYGWTGANCHSSSTFPFLCKK